MDKVLEKLATKAFFSGLKPTEVPPAGYVYRQGKTWADCMAAIHQGIEEGAGKFESEMECAARRLSDVFKWDGG